MSPNWVNQWILPRGGELDVVFEDQMEVALQGRSEPAAAAAGALMRLILPVFSECCTKTTGRETVNDLIV